MLGQDRIEKTKMLLRCQLVYALRYRGQRLLRRQIVRVGALVAP